MLIVIVERTAVLTGEDEITHLFGPVACQDLANGKEIAQRLGHLLIVDTHESVVHPVPDEGMSGRTLGLGNLVLVMREGEIRATAVDIEGVTQGARRHRRALYVPTGPARSPGRVPRRLVRLGRLPQGEIQWVALDVAGFDARTGTQVLDRFAEYRPG